MSRRAVVAVLALLAACDRLPGRPLEADRPIRPRDVRDFARLWDAQCDGCHGENGTLGAGPALANPVYLAWVDDVTLTRVISGGRAGTAMPAFAHDAGGTLTVEQIGVLVTDMRARWGKPLAGAPPPPYADTGGGDATRGHTVWTQRCGACHDAGAAGPVRGGSVVDPAYLALVSDQGLRTAVVAGRPDLGMPDWRGGTGDAPLTAQQVSDVVAWMASHRGGGG